MLFGSVAVLLGACSQSAHVAATPPPPPAQERIPANEPAEIAQTVTDFEEITRKQYAAGVRPAPRGAHPKGQGCVKGRVQILGGKLPGKTGVFERSHTYLAWIRFSNGSTVKQADNVPDGRGMAIKLVGVPGPKLIPDEKFTQDFVMINHPVFFSRNVSDYLTLAKAMLAGDIPKALKELPTTAKVISAIHAHAVRDMFEERYYSMAPFAMGDRYVKYSAIPVRCPNGGPQPVWPAALPSDPNFLRARMAQRLRQSNVCFDFAIQVQTNAATQPVENAAALWSETEAPFVTVAHITIPKQTFTSSAQQTFCENLSFSPWHGTTELRPAGGINRLRLAVYRASSQLRHALDHAQSIEPNGHETFGPQPRSKR